MKIDKDYVFVLIPANKNLDKNKFEKLVNKRNKEINKKSAKIINFAAENG